MSDVTWTVSSGGTTISSSSPSKKRVPYVAKQRVKEDMSEAQKKGIDTWNLMVDVLKENGLMEDK